MLLKQRLFIDSLEQVTLPTNMKRGSRILAIRKKDVIPENTFLDFATTTSSFVKVAEYKMRHEGYKDIKFCNIINEYSQSFIKQTKEILGKDSCYIKFYMSIDDLIKDFKERKKNL